MQFDLFDDSFVIPTIRNQIQQSITQSADKTYFNADHIDLSVYDKFVVCLSGGKDSLACILHLIEQGVDMTRIELWHHRVDGNEGSHLVDWAFMDSYNKAIAKELGLPLYFSWLEGGFEGEMLKQNGYGRPHMVETPSGLITLERDISRSEPSTRLRFPQQAASLQTRWCSSALKIDVGRRALNNQSRFEGSKTLFITGERRLKAPKGQNTASWNPTIATAAVEKRPGMSMPGDRC